MDRDGSANRAGSGDSEPVSGLARNSFFVLHLEKRMCAHNVTQDHTGRGDLGTM